MHIIRMIVCLMLVSLAASCSGASAEDRHSSSNAYQGLIPEINDSLVNSTMDKYPFFVLDCYESWCEPCKEMNATLNQISSELYGQIAFGMIDVEKNGNIANKYNIDHYPTLLIFNNSTLVDTQIGYSSKSKLIDLFRNLRPGLNTSRVNLGAQPQMIVSSPINQGDIPLIGLGANEPALPIKVEDSTVEYALSRYPFFVLMGFADWCGFCKEMNATMLELSNELKGQVAFGLINAEKNNNTTAKYDITSYPRILIFKNGSLAQTQRGYTEKSKFVAILKGIEPSLDISQVNITAAPQPAIATAFPSMPSTAPSKEGTAAIVKEAPSQEDPALKYLDRILNYTQTNHTAGVTVNIFVINACPQSQGK